jgi:hypothetical protein
MVGAPQEPIFREFPLFDLLGSFVEYATHKAYLYLTWLRAIRIWTAFSPVTFMENNQWQLFNILAIWGSGQQKMKIMGYQKALKENLGNEIPIGGL